MFNIKVKVTNKSAFDTFVREMIDSCPDTTKYIITQKSISIKDTNESNWISTSRARKLLKCGEIVNIDIANKDDVSETVKEEEIVSEAADKVGEKSSDKTADFTVIDGIIRESENFHDIAEKLYETFNIRSRENIGANKLANLFEQFEGSTVKSMQVRKHMSNSVAQTLYNGIREYGLDPVVVINYILNNAKMMKNDSDDSSSEDTESD